MTERKLILPDTDVIIEILDKESDKGHALMSKIIDSREDYCTCSINLHKVLFGINDIPEIIKWSCIFQF